MKKVLLLLTVLAASFPLWAEGPLFLELSAKGSRLDMGVAAFSSQNAGDIPRGLEIRGVVLKDLEFLHMFNLIEGGGGSDKDELKAWATLGADLLAGGEVERFLGKTTFSGSVKDVATGDVLLLRKYPLDLGGERAAAHAFVDDIVLYFTGKKGVSSSRIVFVNDATGKKEVCVIDYDGANFRRLTNDRSIALFPKVSPDGKTIVFTTFADGWTTLHLLGVDGNGRRPLCRYEGLNSAAVWLPDSQRLIATLSLGADPSLHIIDKQGRIERTLTHASAVDTAPSPSPDGLQVAFTSDRPGRPQIYVMNTSGANMRRLTMTDGWCDSPAWSPEGNVIAFTMSEKGRNFDIYTIDVGASRLERLTYGEGDNENAVWSPDGRWLAFTSSRRGKPELFIMGADGSTPRPVGDLPGRSFTPYWTGN